MESSLMGLNVAQHTAVTSPSSVLQILAPPGSGKTKTLTSRVAYLLSHHGCKPWNILCLTFTIKSAREMKERIAKLIGNGMEARLILGTFHSVCRRYLVSYGHFIGIRKGFGIADSSDSISIIKRIVKRMNLNIDPKKAQSRISSSKSRGITCMEIARNEARKKNVDLQEFHLVFEAYESHLEQSNLLDYDDLLLRCVDLLQRHPVCVSNVEVVLIDEFQDTNLVQFDLMRLFAAKNKRITTVGDPDQSIYGWRSAEMKNLKRMQEQYPETLIIHLEDNYRSSGAIIISAREVIEQDISREPRPLLPTHCPGTVPVLRRLPTAEIEALWIVSEIKRCTALTGGLLAYSDYAILLRSASLSRHIESAMSKAGIPYRMVGGQRFFDRLEVKILLDYLRVISQPKNNDALSRVINVPPRGIGPATIKTLLERAETARITLWHLIRSIVQGGTVPNIKISKQAQLGLGCFIHMILTAVKRLSDTHDPHSPDLLLRHLTDKLDFEEYLKKTHEQDYDTRWANVEELLAQASDYQLYSKDEKADHDADLDVLPDIEGLQQQKANAAEEALSKFLANVALATEIQREDECEDGAGVPQSRVIISTIHAAKGLEWPVVFIPSAYEGSIPHSRAEDTNEERRLLYVAMTRAQALLCISCPAKNSQREATTLSHFLSSKKVGHFLSNKGPTLGFSAVQDISGILRRECPTEYALSKTCNTAISLEDDRWPLNGEENPEEMEPRWNKWSANDSGMDGNHPFKRRRVQGDNPENASATLTNLTNIPLSTSRSIGVSTTMQNPYAFSYAGGFTTAATRLQVTEAENSSRHSSKSTIKDATLTDKQSIKPLQSYKRPQGQSTLSTFFDKKSSSGSISLPTATARLTSWYSSTDASSLVDAGILIDDEARSTDYEEVPLPMPRSKSNNIMLPTIAERQPPIARKPLSAIPQTLATHRLKPISTSRPRPPLHNDDHPQKGYVFLSSSPPQPTLQSEPKVDDQPEGNSLNNITASNAVRPATTFHTTSIAQAQAQAFSNGARRTLGVKRSMNGWAARGNKSFAVPRSINGGR